MLSSQIKSVDAEKHLFVVVDISIFQCKIQVWFVNLAVDMLILFFYQ